MADEQEVSVDPQVEELASQLMAQESPIDVAPEGDEADEPVDEAPEAPPAAAKAAQQAPAAPAEAPEDPVAKKLAELAKADWETTQEKKKLKEERAALEAHRAEVEATKTKLTRVVEAAKKDKFAAMRAIGIDPNEVVQEILKRGEIPESKEQVEAFEPEPAYKPALDQVSSLKKELEDLKTFIQAREEQNFERETRAAIRSKIETDEYESLSFLDDAENIVFGQIQDHLKSTGKLLTTKEVMDMVKETWEEQLKRWESNEKFRARYGGKVSPPQDTSAKAPPSKSPAKSLSNKQATTPRKPPQEVSGLPSEDELHELAQNLEISWGD